MGDHMSWHGYEAVQLNKIMSVFATLTITHEERVPALGLRCSGLLGCLRSEANPFPLLHAIKSHMRDHNASARYCHAFYVFLPTVILFIVLYTSLLL